MLQFGVKSLVESAVVGGIEYSCFLGDCEHRLLARGFPIKLHVAQLVEGIGKLAFDVGDEDRCALGIVGRTHQQGMGLECCGEVARLGRSESGRLALIFKF